MLRLPEPYRDARGRALLPDMPVGCPQGAPRQRAPATGRRAAIRILTISVVAVCLVVLAAARQAPAATVAQARQEIKRLWGPQAAKAFCVVARESNWNPRAVSQTNDHGLFQINQIHQRAFAADWPRRYDPVVNVHMAWRLYRAAGWSPWNGGRYSC